MEKYLLIFFLAVSTVVINACPEACRCQDNIPESVLFVACEGITTSDGLKEIAVSIPINTTGLSIRHYDGWLFLTHEFPVLTKLRILNIQSGALREVPRYMGKMFPKLQSVYISKTEISKISADQLLDMNNLKSLTLSNSFIDVIKTGTFKYTPNLTNLNLESNHIKKINLKAFNGLTKLSTIILKNNYIKFLKPGTLSFAQSVNYTSMTQINLEGNRIKKIPDDLFSGIRAIKTLNLRNNYITEIGEKAFHNVNMIFELDLSKNFLTQFPIPAVSWKLNSTFGAKEYTNMISLILIDNPLHCDCNVIHLFAHMRRKNLRASIQAYCKSPPIFYQQPFVTGFFPRVFQRCLIPAPLRYP